MLGFVSQFEPRATTAPKVAGFTPTPQAAKNTTGFTDPFATTIRQLKPAATAAQYQPQPQPQGFSAQVAKNTTSYTGTGAGSLPSQQSSDPVVQKIGTLQSSTTPAPAPGSSGAAAAGAYNLSTDPAVLAQVAANQKAYSDAVANAQSAATQDLIGGGFSLGDLLQQNPSLAGTPLGQVLADQSTNLAAQQNPYSTAATLANTHVANQGTIDQTAANNNLYYSSARANQLGQEGQNYLGQVSAEQGKLGQALTALIGGLTTEQNNESTAYANAINTARQNAITNAIASGQVLAGYDQNGNPIFTTLTTVNPDTGGGGGGDTSAPAPLPGAGQVTSPITSAIQGVAVNAKGAAKPNKPGKTVGGYIPGGGINT